MSGKMRFGTGKGVVNCAAITGLDKCEETDFAQVLRANVKMRLTLRTMQRIYRSRLFSFRPARCIDCLLS